MGILPIDKMEICCILCMYVWHIYKRHRRQRQPGGMDSR